MWIRASKSGSSGGPPLPRGGQIDSGLDRINLTSVPHGRDESDPFVDPAETLPSFDAGLVFVDGTDVQFGPFGIEPRHRELPDEHDHLGLGGARLSGPSTPSRVIPEATLGLLRAVAWRRRLWIFGGTTRPQQAERDQTT